MRERDAVAPRPIPVTVTPPARRSRALLVGTLAVLLVAGCSGADTTSPAAQPGTSPPTEPTTPEASDPVPSEDPVTDEMFPSVQVPVTLTVDVPDPGATTSSGRPMPVSPTEDQPVEIVRAADERVVQRVRVQGGSAQVEIPAGRYLVRSAGGEVPVRPVAFVARLPETTVSLGGPAQSLDPPSER